MDNKLSTLQTNVRIGGKGTPRRKKKVVHKNINEENKKFQSSLKKLNAQPVNGIFEVNMFKKDGKVMCFCTPKVFASASANTFIIFGASEEKELSELVPGILNQMGCDSMTSFRKLAGSYVKTQKAKVDEFNTDDVDIPDLVEVFDMQD